MNIRRMRKASSKWKGRLNWGSRHFSRGTPTTTQLEKFRLKTLQILQTMPTLPNSGTCTCRAYFWTNNLPIDGKVSWIINNSGVQVSTSMKFMTERTLRIGCLNRFCKGHCRHACAFCWLDSSVRGRVNDLDVTQKFCWKYVLRYKNFMQIKQLVSSKLNGHYLSLTDIRST